MSHSNLSMGTLPMVRLKNSSSIVRGLTLFTCGRRSNSRPNRTLEGGCWEHVYSLSISWAWSCSNSACTESLKPRISGEEKPIIFVVIMMKHHNVVYRKSQSLLMKLLLREACVRLMDYCAVITCFFFNKIIFKKHYQVNVARITSLMTMLDAYNGWEVCKRARNALGKF